MVRVHRIDTWLHSLRESCAACRKCGKHLRQRACFNSCFLIEHQSSLYYNKTRSEGNTTTNIHGHTLCESTRRGPKGTSKLIYESTLCDSTRHARTMLRYRAETSAAVEVGRFCVYFVSSTSSVSYLLSPSLCLRISCQRRV